MEIIGICQYIYKKLCRNNELLRIIPNLIMASIFILGLPAEQPFPK